MEKDPLDQAEDELAELVQMNLERATELKAAMERLSEARRRRLSEAPVPLVPGDGAPLMDFRKEFLYAVGRLPQPFSPHQVCAVSRWSLRTIHNWIKQEVAAGHLRRVDFGLYCVEEEDSS